MTDLSCLVASSDVVVTEKMDGENTTIHRDGCHARSPDSGYHASRDWMKAFAAAISPHLGATERIVGEYLFARHAIAYDALPSYFLGFALIEGGIVAPWDITLARFGELGIESVPVLYRGPFHDGLISEIVSTLDFDRQEGFVLRTADAFPESEMATHIGKYVRQGHVQSDTHWTQSAIVKNRLA